MGHLPKWSSWRMGILFTTTIKPATIMTAYVMSLLMTRMEKKLSIEGIGHKDFLMSLGREQGIKLGHFLITGATK